MTSEGVTEIPTIQGNFSLRAISPLYRPSYLNRISSVFQFYIRARRYSPTADDPGARLQKNNPVLSEFQKGFTLLEVMISLAIIGGVLLTLIYSLNYHLGIAGRHETLTVASMLAKEKMADAELSPLSTSGDFERPYEAFHYKTEVSESEFPGFSELSVTVTNEKESVTFTELIHSGANVLPNNAT